jgi:hypothetical protein
MSSSLIRWTLRIAALGVVAMVVARLLAGRSTGDDGPVLPAITGDTWPPVPTNPDRKS